MKVVYYEGLFGSIGRWLYRGLIKDLEKEFPDVEFIGRSWLNGKPLPENTVLVIGHSFGAVRALDYDKQGIPIVTIDPRVTRWSEFTTGGEVYNYYQRSSGLLGCYVVGAINYLVKNASHLTIQKHVYVYKECKRILEEV